VKSRSKNYLSRSRK